MSWESGEAVYDDHPHSVLASDAAGDEGELGADVHGFDANQVARCGGGVPDEPVSEVDGSGAAVGVASVNDQDGLVGSDSLLPDPEVAQTKRYRRLAALYLRNPECRQRRKVEFGILRQVLEDIQDAVHCGLISSSCDLNVLYPSILEELAQTLRSGSADPLQVADRIDKIAADTRKSTERIFRYGQLCQTAIQTGLQLVRYGLTHDAHDRGEQ